MAMIDKMLEVIHKPADNTPESELKNAAPSMNHTPPSEDEGIVSQRNPRCAKDNKVHVNLEDNGIEFLSVRLNRTGKELHTRISPIFIGTASCEQRSTNGQKFIQKLPKRANAKKAAR